MKKASACVARGLSSATALLLLSVSQPAVAQNLTPGKYSGYVDYVNNVGQKRTNAAEIRIDKVDGTAVQGAYVRSGVGFCNGETPIKGVLEGDKLTLKADRDAGEVKQGCGVHLELKVSGEKLEGKAASGAAVKFSK